MGLLRRRPSLLLINPGNPVPTYWDMRGLCRAMGLKATNHPVALPLLAALTPSRWKVRIVDAELEPIPFRAKPDVVGITALVSNIDRAFEIADRYRRKGVTVVMGGPHVSTNEAAALEHCDAVVIGEAETLWERVLADVEAGTLQRRYQADAPIEFKTQVRPRWDLIDTSKLGACGVEVSRGCPFRCDFCMVRTIWGDKQRYRDVDDVIDELRSLPTKRVSFLDDNLTANRKLARELMRKMLPLGLSWFCQMSIDAAFDQELLELMAEAGCESVLVGFESLRPEGLAEACKKHNKIERYGEAIANIQAAGIHIVGSFVVGFDSDRLDVLDEIYEFGQEHRLSYVMVNALLALPGCDLHDRMKSEGRLTPSPPEKAAGIYPTHTLKHMSQADLFLGLLRTLERSYSYQAVYERMPTLFANGAFNRRRPSDISVVLRIRTSLAILSSLLVTTDPYRRRFLTEMIDLIRSKRADPNGIVPYVLMVNSVQEYLRAVRRDADRIADELRRQEQEHELRASSR